MGLLADVLSTIWKPARSNDLYRPVHKKASGVFFGVEMVG